MCCCLFNIFHAFLVQPHHDVWGPVVITILLSVLYNVISVASAFLLYKKTERGEEKSRSVTEPSFLTGDSLAIR